MSQYIAIISACNSFTPSPRPSLSISSRILESNNMSLNLPSLPMLSTNAKHPNYAAQPLKSRQCGLKVHASINQMHADIADEDWDFDTILSVAEITCLVVSGLLLAGFSNRYPLHGPGVLMLLAGAAVGAWIRNRQLKRINELKKQFKKVISEGNLIERIEKLEEESKEINRKLNIQFIVNSISDFLDHNN